MAADKRVRGCERESVEHADKEQELAHPLRFVWHRQIATDDPTASYTQQAVCLAINLDQSRDNVLIPPFVACAKGTPHEKNESNY